MCQQLGDDQPCREGGAENAADTTADVAASSFTLIPPPAPSAALPPSFCHAVPHIPQALTWDCGLACACMALHALGRRRHTVASLRALCPTSSVWTIDLARLLHVCGARVALCSLILGARPECRAQRYYADTSPDDLRRVDRAFQDAAAAGIPLHQCSLPLQRLKTLLLEGRWLIILLVDRMQLENWATATASGGGGAPSLAGSGAGAARQRHLARDYTGHYLFLCGYDAAADEFDVRDPAAAAGDAGRARLAAGAVEVARRAQGTDEDVLLIEMKTDTAAS